MKDLVIRGQSIRRECRIAAACLLVGILVNVGAILGYHRPWTELFSQLGYVVVLTVILYLLIGVIRLFIHAICLIIRKLQRK